MLDNEQDHPESHAVDSTDINSPSGGNKKKPTLRQRIAARIFRIPHRLNKSSAGYVPFVLWLLLLFGGIWFPAETVLHHVINDKDAPVGILFGTVADPSVKSDDEPSPKNEQTSGTMSKDQVAVAGSLKNPSEGSSVSGEASESILVASNNKPSLKTTLATDVPGTDEVSRSKANSKLASQDIGTKKKDTESPKKNRMKLKVAVILLIICPLFWSWSNIALLCLMSSGMGEMNRAAEEQANGNKISPDYRSACTRAFFVYLFVLLNELAMVGKLETDDGGYARIAVLASLVAFVASYRPSFYQGLISKVSTAGVSGDNQVGPNQDQRPQANDPNAGGDDEARQLQPVGAPDDEFGSPSPGDDRPLPTNPK